MDAMTEQELDAIRKRCDMATPLPWNMEDVRMSLEETETYDAEFLLHAREDIPRLLDELARLRRVAIDAENRADDAEYAASERGGEKYSALNEAAKMKAVLLLLAESCAECARVDILGINLSKILRLKAGSNGQRLRLDIIHATSLPMLRGRGLAKKRIWQGIWQIKNAGKGRPSMSLLTTAALPPKLPPNVVGRTSATMCFITQIRQSQTMSVRIGIRLNVAG